MGLILYRLEFVVYVQKKKNIWCQKILFLLTKWFGDRTTKTRNAKIRHMPITVLKPKDTPISKTGNKIFHKVYFLLRMR